jgi:hypothetical protein
MIDNRNGAFAPFLFSLFYLDDFRLKRISLDKLEIL